MEGHTCKFVRHLETNRATLINRSLCGRKIAYAAKRKRQKRECCFLRRSGLLSNYALHVFKAPKDKVNGHEKLRLRMRQQHAFAVVARCEAHDDHDPLTNFWRRHNEASIQILWLAWWLWHLLLLGQPARKAHSPFLHGAKCQRIRIQKGPHSFSLDGFELGLLFAL